MIRQDIKQLIFDTRTAKKDIVDYINKEGSTTCTAPELSMALSGKRTTPKSDLILEKTEQYLLNKTMNKPYLTKADIQIKYDCGENTALKIIRSIKEVCDGGVLGRGRVLPAELKYWEEKRGRA